MNYSVQIQLTNEEIEDILCTAIEGGIGYWACLRNDLKEWREAESQCCELFGKNNTFYSTVMLYLLANGGKIVFEDAEDPSERWTLTKRKFLNGCKMYEQHRGSIKKSLDDGGFDAIEADCLIQYALFNEIVFG